MTPFTKAFFYFSTCMVNILIRVFNTVSMGTCLRTASGNVISLSKVSNELSKRLVSTFRKNENGHRPVNGNLTMYHDDPNFKDLILFYEYFHGDRARGAGASQQTGWTGVIAELINRISKPLSPEGSGQALSKREGGQAVVQLSIAELAH